MSLYQVIDDIRSRLYGQGYEPYEIEDICETAAEYLSEMITDAVASALDEAERAGLESGMKDFVSDITAVQAGDTFLVVTKSGRTDYSTPKKRMRDALLKHAKVAKDGSRYARIPISDKGDRASSSFDVDKARSAHLEQVKSEIEADIRQGGIGRDIGKAARDYSSSFSAIRDQVKAETRSPKRSNTIRTVSSKQNPDTQWVIPPKHMDAADILSQVNLRLQDDIEHAKRQIYQEFVG